MTKTTFNLTHESNAAARAIVQQIEKDHKIDLPFKTCMGIVRVIQSVASSATAAERARIPGRKKVVKPRKLYQRSNDALIRMAGLEDVPLTYVSRGKAAVR